MTVAANGLVFLTDYRGFFPSPELQTPKSGTDKFSCLISMLKAHWERIVNGAVLSGAEKATAR